MIKANTHKYSVSAMCRVLKVPRTTYYYEAKPRSNDPQIVTAVIECFKESRNNYGTRKIKKELAGKDILVSRRKKGNIMKQEGLVSNYTVAQFKPEKTSCNEEKVENIVKRQLICTSIIKLQKHFKKRPVKRSLLLYYPSPTTQSEAVLLVFDRPVMYN